jgi:hypothetical protein
MLLALTPSTCRNIIATVQQGGNMKRPSARPTPQLSASLHQRVNAYAVAASATGMAALALAQPAWAKIVYTPTNIRIVQNGGLISFDLNHDGISDFGLSNKYVSTSQGFAFLGVKQHQQANEIWQVRNQGRVCAGALAAGRKIGPKGNFHNDPKAGLPMAFANFEGTYYGPWLKVKQAYLGLRFVIKGKTHFGWARVKLTSTGRLSIEAALTGYAYETIPNKAIIAGKTKGPTEAKVTEQPNPTSLAVPTPEPATLGMLALGSPKLSIWHREESIGATQ